jgi:hypothetical protein
MLAVRGIGEGGVRSAFASKHTKGLTQLSMT